MARKAAEKLRKTEYTDKHLPLAKRTGNLPPRGSALQGEGVEATGEMESQEDKISKTQNKEIKTEETEIKWDWISETQNTPEVTASDLPPREYKVLSPLLPRTPRHIEWRRRLGQNPAFLPALD